MHFFDVYILPYLNFLIFFLVLAYFAKNPMKKFFDERKESYLNSLATASKAKKEAEAKWDELQKRYERLDKELENIRKLALLEADREAKKIIDEGIKLGEFYAEEARRIAQIEMKQATVDFQQELLEAARSGVLKHIEESLTPALQVEKIQEKLNQLKPLIERG